MATTAPRTTATLPSATVRIAMDEVIDILPIDDVPLQNYLATEPVSNIKNQWLNEELDTQVCVPANNSSTTGTATVTVTDATNIRINDVLKRKGGTVMAHVTGVNYGSGVLNITRPFAGSTDENLVTTDTLEIVGQNLTEGADPQDPRATDPTGDFNYTQVYQEKVAASRTARKNMQYALGDQFAHDTEKKYRELNVRHERGLIHGRRNQSGSTRQFGGLLQFINVNLPSGVKANLDTLTNDMLQSAYDFGATPRTLVCSPAIKRLYSALNASLVNEQRGDTGIGRVKSTYESDFGSVELVMDRHLPKTKAILLQTEYVKRQVFDSWFMEPLAKTGDSDVAHIVGEFSLKVKNPKAHGVLTITDA